METVGLRSKVKMSNSKSKGKFIDFCLNYDDLSSQQQADHILKKAIELVHNGAKGAAITYSANYGQTRTIEKVYLANGWYTGTNGANQAQIMSEMEKLLANIYQSMQGKLRIAPITTMNAYDQPVQPWGDDVLMGIVITDLDRIERYLENDWCVLGWQNQTTINNPTQPYAAGGGVAKLPATVSKKIQDTLIGYAARFGH